MLSLKKPWEYGPLQLHKSGKYLQNGPSNPFFWLGDTGWLIPHRLDRDEIDLYLQNRKDKGFNVIQVVAVHSLPQINWFGKNALQGDSFASPETEGDYSFWDHLDYLIQKAEELGLYIGLLPCWGSMVKNERLTLENVQAYGNFLAKRYQNTPNLIWILGGDVRGDIHPEVWDALAIILKEARPDRLLAFHPFGRTCSARWFAGREWLSIHMFQSGHRRYDQKDLQSWDDLSKAEEWYGEDNWKYVEYSHSQDPSRPVLDGEPSYEQIPQGLHNPQEPYWQDHDVRRYAYWSVFAGACGFTYGSNAVMQALKDCYGPAFGARENWDEAIHHPGAGQMGLLKQLMECFPYTRGGPRQELLEGFEGEKYRRISVFGGEDYALCYNYTGRPFALRLGQERLKGEKLKAWWFDPSSGVFSYCGEYLNEGVRTFTPAKRAQGQNDCVLVLCRSGSSYLDLEENQLKAENRL